MPSGGERADSPDSLFDVNLDIEMDDERNNVRAMPPVELGPLANEPQAVQQQGGLDDVGNMARALPHPPRGPRPLNFADRPYVVIPNNNENVLPNNAYQNVPPGLDGIGENPEQPQIAPGPARHARAGRAARRHQRADPQMRLINLLYKMANPYQGRGGGHGRRNREGGD